MIDPKNYDTDSGFWLLLVNSGWQSARDMGRTDARRDWTDGEKAWCAQYDRFFHAEYNKWIKFLRKINNK